MVRIRSGKIHLTVLRLNQWIAISVDPECILVIVLYRDIYLKTYSSAWGVFDLKLFATWCDLGQVVISSLGSI